MLLHVGAKCGFQLSVAIPQCCERYWWVSVCVFVCVLGGVNLILTAEPNPTNLGLVVVDIASGRHQLLDLLVVVVV